MRTNPFLCISAIRESLGHSMKLIDRKNALNSRVQLFKTNGVVS